MALAVDDDEDEDGGIDEAAAAADQLVVGAVASGVEPARTRANSRANTSGEWPSRMARDST